MGEDFEKTMGYACATRLVFGIVLSVLIGFSLSACGEKERPKPPKTEAEMYPGKWQESVAPDLSIALARNKISGCGQFEHRRARGGDEYLVACTRDGERWTGYIVFPRIEKVVGPINLESPPQRMSER